MRLALRPSRNRLKIRQKRSQTQHLIKEVKVTDIYRKKYQDDIRPIEPAVLTAMGDKKLREYLHRLKDDKPNLAGLEDRQIYELMNIKRDDQWTLASVILFSLYPQAYFPQLCIIVIAVPNTEIGDTAVDGARFLDNKCIEGTVIQMLEGAIQLVKNNMRTKTIIDDITGKRIDKDDYPIKAVREILLNALVHRDYSIHTAGMPIQLAMYADRLEVTNSGGLYGRLTLSNLGKIQPDTRNPVLATALEVLKVTENRYSGIPTIRKEMAEHDKNFSVPHCQ